MENSILYAKIAVSEKNFFPKLNFKYYMCSILTKGSTCRKNKKLRFFLILIAQVMTNLLKKN